MGIRRPQWADVWVVAGLLAVAIVWAAVPVVTFSFINARDMDAFGYLLLIAMVVPLLWRQDFPRTVMWAVAFFWAVSLALGYELNPAHLALYVGVYGLSAYLPRWTALRHAAVLAGLTMAGVTLAVIVDGSTHATILIAVPVDVIIPLALGFADRRRRERASETEVAQAQLEQHDYSLAADAVRAERARIARELHDVVAHEITVMTLQAEGAKRRLSPNDPDLVQALETIASAGRKGLEEMQRMIGVLRASEQEANERVDVDRALASGVKPRGVTPTDSLTPLPSLAALPALVRDVQNSGLPVTLEISGSAHVPAGVEVSAYRIVQEALTNALKHGGPGTRADVTIMRTADALRITVEDNGRGMASDSIRLPGGHGLAGMGERVQALGGALSHGPRPGGGYQVHVVLPSRDEATEKHQENA